MSDVFTKALDELASKSLLRNIEPLLSLGSCARVVKSGKELLNLSSNDYLNVSLSLSNEFINNIKNLDEFEIEQKDLLFGASGSRLLGGGHMAFFKLEDYLASTYRHGKEALFFNSGYHLNVGVISALAKLEGTLFLVDKQAHASIIDGLRLGAAKFIRYAHNDLEALERLVWSNCDKFKRLIVVTEALFSMDGDLADVAFLVDLKRRCDKIMLYIDEAHSVGACGERGLGLVYASGLADEVDFVVFTFGKALASAGASLLCAKQAKSWLVSSARSLIYSTAIAPISVCFTLFALEKIAHMNDKREHLARLSAWLYEKLESRGARVLGKAHILSIVAGSNEAALSLASRLERAGYYAPAIRPPTVAPNSARVRLSLHAGLEKSELQGILNAL